MKNKDVYRDWCTSENMPLFEQPGWLDATCGDNWDVIIVKNKSNIIATFPYEIKSVGPLRILKTNASTLFQEVIIHNFENSSYIKKLSKTKSTLIEIINNLPKADIYNFKVFVKESYYLPFLWNNFSLSPRFTYQIDTRIDIAEIKKNLSPKVRNFLNKDNSYISIQEVDSTDILYDLIIQSFKSKATKPTFNKSELVQIDSYCKSNGKRKILIAYENNQPIAAIYLAWDAKKMYYLFGGTHHEFRQSQPGTLLLWEALNFSHSLQKVFDFEGSIIEPIESYFRSFGGKPVMYFRASRQNSFIAKIATYYKNLKFPE